MSARTATGLILAATLTQLVAATVSDLDQFAGKGFGARLVAYPVLMLAVPAGYGVARHLSSGSSGSSGDEPLPWTAFALLMAPFLVDVTGNSLNLYDSVGWWDDANHLVNWFLLSSGIGLLLARTAVRPRWALGVLVAGIGAQLAVGWELGEWYTFIRQGTELDGATEPGWVRRDDPGPRARSGGSRSLPRRAPPAGVARPGRSRHGHRFTA